MTRPMPKKRPRGLNSRRRKPHPRRKPNPQRKPDRQTKLLRALAVIASIITGIVKVLRRVM